MIMNKSLLLVLLLVCWTPSGTQGLFLGRPIAPRLQCFLRMALFRFKIDNFDRFGKYFRDDSEMTLAQTGKYQGANAIEEYVKFLFSEFSPYFETEEILEDQLQFMGYDDDSGECIYLVQYYSFTQPDGVHTSSNTGFNVANMIKLHFNYRERYIPRIYVYYTESFVDLLFGSFLNSNMTREYVCDIIEGPCSSYVVGTPADCEGALEALPVTESSSTLQVVDSNSQGCRALHAVFAATNPTQHCPHISLTPTPDPDGSIKCDTSQNIQVSDLFAENELERFRVFSEKYGLDPDIGHNYPSA